MDQVVLVDKEDNEIGTMDKMEAHLSGSLHRAFSVLLFDSSGKMFLQKRASSKYHSGGLWSNACCSHPKPGENINDAVTRRLKEELGIEVETTFSYKFVYRISFDNDLEEHEFDYVFMGTFDGTPDFNADEIEDWKFMDRQELMDDVDQNPNDYTHWFKLILQSKSSLYQA